MIMDSITLVFTTFFIIAVVLVVTVLNFIQNHKVKKLQKELEQLEVEKNVIDSTPIVPELAKIEILLKNGKLDTMYQEWKNRLDQIKTVQIPKITDMLIEADYSLSQMDYKNTLYKIAKLEMELYKVRTNSDFLLNEIKDITNSEEKNRAIITNLKATYRELYQRFLDTTSEYGKASEYVKNQFTNIASYFESFEKAMEDSDFPLISKIIKNIDDMLKHMKVVIEEVPAIILLVENILPKRMQEVSDVYEDMVRDGYPLDYLNVEYNITEANKKISDVMDRLKMLDLEDSLFELKVLLEYFDSLFGDFEKEKINRSTYEESNYSFSVKLAKINALMDDIFDQMDDIKNIYHLSDTDVNTFYDIRDLLDQLNEDYKVLIGHTSNHTFAYSKLTKEIENLLLRLAKIEERLDSSLDAIGDMRDDEVRARQQLEEVKLILKDAKNKLREYNLPLVPKSYFVELNEAQAAIKEIVRELDKKPITIDVLNTRVDTARDLVLKLYGKTKEMMKTAMFAEMAIVYGNRYRTSVEDLDKQLMYSEVLFFKGEYQKSLEYTINSLNRVEPGIYEKLLDFYTPEKQK